MNYDLPGLRDRLAAEFVLGTLHGRARERFQRLMKKDIKYRTAVEQWERRIMPMATPLRAPAPGAEVWRAIEKRVAPAVRAEAERGFFERWLGARTLGALAAGVVIGVAAMQVAPMLKDRGVGSVAKTQLPESYAGFLADDKGKVTMLVSSLRHGSFVDIKVLRPVVLPQGGRLLLWALPASGTPFVIGEVPTSGKETLRMTGTSEQLLANVTELAVAVELPGAPPRTSTPQAFLLRGPCAKFW